jgi:hypothetical protein
MTPQEPYLFAEERRLFLRPRLRGCPSRLPEVWGAHGAPQQQERHLLRLFEVRRTGHAPAVLVDAAIEAIAERGGVAGRSGVN